MNSDDVEEDEEDNVPLKRKGKTSRRPQDRKKKNPLRQGL